MHVSFIINLVLLIFLKLKTCKENNSLNSKSKISNDYFEYIKTDGNNDHVKINENHTFNIEKLNLIKKAPQYNLTNPLCDCGKRMKSAGKNKGYKCPKCGKKIRSSEKIKELINRDIQEGFYEVPTEARRHLSKPIVRMNL